MPRQPRLDSPGTLQHVIVRGIEKRKIVDDRKDRENFVKRMGEIATDTNTTIYAWALMTNHAHILLRSGVHGLSKYMRRLLTSYAITYKRRHKSHGPMFQNRYTSIVCDEDAYFRELVRYIHLNPLRAKAVKKISDLEKYPWCGHAVVMGRIKQEWQDRDHVLSWFGKKEGEAKKAYRKYVKDGIAQGRRPELVGGGLIRSVGGWSEVKSLRRRKEKVFTDERVLGRGDFVSRILKESDKRLRQQLARAKGTQKTEKFIKTVCKKEKVSLEELFRGGRRRHVSAARRQIAYRLVEDFGIPLAEAARRLGVSPSAISKAVRRVMEE
jgi:REP element-mobilizing transposase RayT